MSTLRLTTISNQTGSSSVPSDTVISGSAKAWVNFNGTGTVAIRTSFNVSSITDNGTGDYTVNFTVAMVDANYSASGYCIDTVGSGTNGSIVCGARGSTPTASTFRFTTKFNQDAGLTDINIVNIQVFR
tara:strand:- start:3144 stop:3530 length:387 start_codon:yes stop_codon:yes gene_type:complete